MSKVKSLLTALPYNAPGIAVIAVLLGVAGVVGLQMLDTELALTKRAQATASIGLPAMTIDGLPSSSLGQKVRWSVAQHPNGVPYAYRSNGAGSIDYLAYRGAGKFQYRGTGPATANQLLSENSTPLAGISFLAGMGNLLTCTVTLLGSIVFGTFWYLLKRAEVITVNENDKVIVTKRDGSSSDKVTFKHPVTEKEILGEKTKLEEQKEKIQDVVQQSKDFLGS